MLFDVVHIVYILLSLIATVVILIVLSKLKTLRQKDIALKIIASVTLFIHMSLLWVMYLQQNLSELPDGILFPNYMCNLSIWLLFFIAFCKKDTKIFNMTATFVAYIGFFGGIISLFYPDYYVQTPDITQWKVLKAFLAHSGLLLGSLYLFVAGYVKIRVKNIIPFCYGLLFSGAVGGILIGLFLACGLPNPNSMYLVHSPIPEVPILNGYFIAFLMVIVTLFFNIIWEYKALPPNERWYKKQKKT